MSSDLINISPALQQCLSDAVHSGIRSMVRVIDIIHHLLCVPSVGGGEWLVPLSEDERVGLGAGVL